MVLLPMALVKPLWSLAVQHQEGLRKIEIYQEVKGAEHVSYKKLLRELMPLSRKKI